MFGSYNPLRKPRVSSPPRYGLCSVQLLDTLLRWKVQGKQLLVPRRRDCVLESEQEGVTGTIDLPDDDPATFARMVSFLYTMKYDDGASTAITAATRPWVPSIGGGHIWRSIGDTPLYRTTANALVYALADKYNVPGLGELAEVKFKASIAFCSLRDLPDVVETVLNAAPPWSGLYDALVDICGADLEALMNDEYFLRVLNNHTEFGNELFQRHHMRLLIRSRLERIELESEKEDHARTKTRLRVAEKILIQNNLYDVRVGLKWCPLPLTKQLGGAKEAHLGS